MNYSGSIEYLTLCRVINVASAWHAHVVLYVQPRLLRESKRQLLMYSLGNSKFFKMSKNTSRETLSLCFKYFIDYLAKH